METTLSAADTAATVTHSGEAQRHHVVTKVDFSYSSPNSSGLCTITYGVVTVAQKHCHGAGAVDHGVFGFEDATANQYVVVTLAAGGTGVLGVITITGYTTGPRGTD